MRAPLAFGLADHCTPQSLVLSDDSAGPLARYFFGTTPLYGPLFSWRSVQVAAPTSGSTQQFVTIPGIGTPLVVIVEATRVLTAQTQVTEGMCAVGAADEFNQIGYCNRHRHNVNTTDTGRIAGSGDDGFLLLINTTADTIDGQAKFVRWVMDGCELQWLDFPAGAYLLTFTFIYGIAARASVKRLVTSGVDGGTDSITGLTYAPNLAFVYFARIAAASPFASNPNAFLHFGMACDNEGTVEQGSYDLCDDDNRSGLDQFGWSNALRDDAVIQDLNQSPSGATTVDTMLDVQSFNSDGITFHTSNGTLAFNALVIPIYTGGNRRTIRHPDLDTATTGTGTNKKVTTTWSPKLIRAVGTRISVV